MNRPTKKQVKEFGKLLKNWRDDQYEFRVQATGVGKPEQWLARLDGRCEILRYAVEEFNRWVESLEQ